MQSLRDLLQGIRHHPWRTAGAVFTAFSVLFTLARAATYFVPSVKFEGPLAITVVVGVSAGFGLWKVRKPSRIEIRVAHTNTTIEIVFGDLFTQDGIRVIAVNEFFDSKLGLPVSDKSLHGIFLKRCFGGHPDSFDKQLIDQLQEVTGEEVSKVDGKTKRYPIGTTAMVTVDQDRYLAFAFAKTDPNTCKASANVTQMWVALSKLWQRARVEAGGHSLNVPLVGSGLSGLGLPTRDLLNLIILSAITETKVKQITPLIRLVLHRDRFDEIDLRDVEAYWDN